MWIIKEISLTMKIRKKKNKTLAQHRIETSTFKIRIHLRCFCTRTRLHLRWKIAENTQCCARIGLLLLISSENDFWSIFSDRSNFFKKYEWRPNELRKRSEFREKIYENKPIMCVSQFLIVYILLNSGNLFCKIEQLFFKQPIRPNDTCQCRMPVDLLI